LYAHEADIFIFICTMIPIGIPSLLLKAN